MSLDEQLKGLAQGREDKADSHLSEMCLISPDRLMRELRAYLARQAELGRIRRSNERAIQINKPGGGIDELFCPEMEFKSGAILEFRIRGVTTQPGWMVKQFKFHLRLPGERVIDMVRIHLNAARSHEPLRVPRCHLHIGRSEAHVPFPVMHPLLILQLLCEHLESDLGAQPIEG